MEHAEHPLIGGCLRMALFFLSSRRERGGKVAGFTTGQGAANPMAIISD